jgi:hypothetical protein
VPRPSSPAGPGDRVQIVQGPRVQSAHVVGVASGYSTTHDLTFTSLRK